MADRTPATVRYGPLLDDDGVGPLAHLGDDPVTAPLGAGAARNPRAEVELRLDVAQRGLAIERGARAVGAVARGERHDNAGENGQFHGVVGDGRWRAGERSAGGVVCGGPGSTAGPRTRP